MTSIHGETRYQCDQCDYKASTQEDLRQHTKTIHEKYSYKCDQCDYRAQQKEDITKHTKSRHESNQPSIESFIKKVRKETSKETEKDTDTDEISISTQEIILDARARRQNKTNKFNCDKCEFESGSITLMQKHEDTNHKIKKSELTKKSYKTKRLTCKYCENKFNKNETLQKHLEKFHKENLRKEFHQL